MCLSIQLSRYKAVHDQIIFWDCSGEELDLKLYYQNIYVMFIVELKRELIIQIQHYMEQELQYQGILQVLQLVDK